eukprot:5104336-Prymnesium_polylepis.1
MRGAGGGWRCEGRVAVSGAVAVLLRGERGCAARECVAPRPAAGSGRMVGCVVGPLVGLRAAGARWPPQKRTAPRRSGAWPAPEGGGRPSGESACSSAPSKSSGSGGSHSAVNKSESPPWPQTSGSMWSSAAVERMWRRGPASASS